MNYQNSWIVGIFLTISTLGFAQKSDIFTNPLKAYNHAVDLYNNRDFAAAKHEFSSIKKDFDNISERRANCEYYEAFSTIQLGEADGDRMMKNFVENYPTSTKQNAASLQVGDYYFKNGKYPYALKWYKKVETRNLSIAREEDFTFKYAYSLFIMKHYPEAKEYFQQLFTSYEYGSQAKYYFGFMAYQNDDFDNADKYLGQIKNDKGLGKDVPYYMANIKFKKGEFKEAIEVAKPFLATADRKQKSEISKIIGESYFNLEQYGEAIPYLKEYKGKHRKWNNTDYYLLGYAYYMQKDYESAISYFNKIINGTSGVSQNAYYHLAECYLKTDQKTEALNAFRNTLQMKANKDIIEDAWLNYAKLSYEIGNPYKSVPDVLQEYLDTYPKSAATEEIEKLLISSYITSKDYEGALKVLKGKKEEKEIYQKAALYRGIQLFQDKNIEAAKNHFKIAIATPKDNSITARAVFWNAEADYLQTNYTKALSGFQEYKTMSKSDTLTENKSIDYNIAYAYFKQKDYNKAGAEFQTYLDTNPEDKNKKTDSYLRLGDSYYVSSTYNKAIESYSYVVQQQEMDVDYAHFQRAMSYGFIRKNNKKITDLVKFIEIYPKSTLRDDAYYELGNSYIRANENEKALQSYEELLRHYKHTSYVPKALLKQGLVYYNTNKNNQALEKYKRVVNEFPNTDEAKQAVANARQVYVDAGRVDEYADWVKNISFINVTDKELDNDMYESAEKQYLENNRKKAIPAFRKYIERFPDGIHALQANFYMAESLFGEKQQDKAINFYSYVVAHERNEYTEQALSRLAQVYLEADQWEKAMPLLKRLELEADFPQNITFAQSNLMKGHYELKHYEQAVTYAEKVLQRSKLENRVKSDAKIIIARSAMKTGDEYKAQEAYEEVNRIAKGKLKAEALYFDAYFKHKDEDYEGSNTVVQKLVADYAAYKYYGAKGLILMAKNFYKLEDAFQATYILESVIKNFSDFEDVVREAKSELQKIKAKESKTNESVNSTEH